MRLLPEEKDIKISFDYLQAAYETVFERNLMEDVRDETSGDFQTLLTMMLLAQRDESWEVDGDAAEADAQAIFDVCLLTSGCS